MNIFLSLVCLGLLISVEAIPSINGPLDIKKLQTVLNEGSKSNDLSSLFYSVKGYSLLNEKVANAKEICDIAKKSDFAKLSTEQTYFAGFIADKLSCRDILPPTILKNALAALNDKAAPLSDVHYGVMILKLLGKDQHDSEITVKALSDILKKDDSVTTLAAAIRICADVGCEKWALERSEDLLIQADEVDDRLLQWDGGLTITSVALTSIFRAAEAAKKPTPITAEQAVKFGNYLLSRNTVQTVKGATLLLEAALVLAQNTAISPVSISLKRGKQLSREADQVAVLVTDIMGQPLKSLKPESVIAQSATRLVDDVVVLSKQTLVATAQDKSLFSLDIMKVKPAKGLYRLALSAGPATSSVTIRVLGEILLDNVEVGLSEVDGTSGKKMVEVKYPNKIPQALEADSMQKLVLKFAAKDKVQNQATSIHQAFVRFWNKDSQEEYVLVAEQDSAKTYRMDVDISSLSEAFYEGSGSYGIEIIIGDNLIVNPVKWHLVDLTLKFTQQVEKNEKKVQQRSMRPEINHLFRTPEPRPPRVMSDAFTALCALPFLLLLILWSRIGVNVSNFPFVLSAITFHIGLGAILGLFVVFWLQLTMFETVRYLLGLGLITFISGHRLLRHIVSQKKAA